MSVKLCMYSKIVFEILLKWTTNRERGEGSNTKIWISRGQRELFRWKKKHFPQFFKCFLSVKNWKIADINFKTSIDTPHKIWSFPIRISSVNVTKSAVFWGFGHTYWRILSGKLHFLCSDMFDFKSKKCCAT